MAAAGGALAGSAAIGAQYSVICIASMPQRVQIGWRSGQQAYQPGPALRPMVRPSCVFRLLVRLPECANPAAEGWVACAWRRHC